MVLQSGRTVHAAIYSLTSGTKADTGGTSALLVLL